MIHPPAPIIVVMISIFVPIKHFFRVPGLVSEVGVAYERGHWTRAQIHLRIRCITIPLSIIIIEKIGVAITPWDTSPARTTYHLVSECHIPYK
jgi:hypothetical protein